MRRSHRPEILDHSDVPEPALARSYRDVERVNRWLGGYRALRRHLGDLAEGPEPRKFLDVGAGDGATLVHLERWAPTGWSWVGIEISEDTARLARRNAGASVGIVRGDGLRLPFPDGVFDAVLCTLTLHHFTDVDAVRLLREMARVSRDRIIVNDLRRSRLHWWAAKALAMTVWARSPITRHDGPLSVRRSFTPAEVALLADAAGYREFRVVRRPVFRVVLEGRVDRARGQAS